VKEIGDFFHERESGLLQRTRFRSHVCRPGSIFSDVHAAGKMILSICGCGRKLCEAQIFPEKCRKYG